MDAHERFGGGSLQVRGRARVYRRAQEVVGGRVADVELDGGIELGELEQIRAAKPARLGWRPRGERLGAQLRYRPLRRDAKDAVAADALGQLCTEGGSGHHQQSCGK
jgi:hypothetical protein